MLDVYLTFDVEIWCGGWDDLEARFPGAFARYVYGRTPRGDYGLPFTLRVLADHGLNAVFFVEPLFATRFGLQPLAEITGLIRAARQDIELHLHTEWVDESIEPLLPPVDVKRRFMRDFSQSDQATLIAAGKRLMAQAGVEDLTAFRAGGFGFNEPTLGALIANGIRIDSSYNASMFGRDSGVMPGTILTDTVECGGILEYPMTVFTDWNGRLRHAQLGACSYRELEGLLWKSLEERRRSFVLLSHNFELLNQARNRPDDIVVDRYRRVCAFLERNSDSFRTREFKSRSAGDGGPQPPPLQSPRWKAVERVAEQVYRRRYG